jgi:hypothetical protein
MRRVLTYSATYSRSGGLRAMLDPRFRVALFIAFLVAPSRMLSAAPPAITQGPWVTGITRSSAVLSWVTDSSATSKVTWGTSPGSLNNTQADGGAPTVIHSWYATGLPGGTTIYYQVCSTNSSGTTCSAPGSFSTSVQTAIPAPPVAPTPVDTPVAPTGNILTVGPNCDDPATGLVAMWSQANWGDIVEIDPAVTPFCAGSYVFPAKAGNTDASLYVLTRVKNVLDLGSEQITPFRKPKMARFVHTAPNVIMIGSADPSGLSCFAGSYLWRQGQSNAWAMYRCNNVNGQSIGSIPSSGNLQITVAAHGYSNTNAVCGTGVMGWISGVTGTGASGTNGPWFFNVLDANTLELHPCINSGIAQATGPTSGGTVAINQFQLEPVVEGTVPPSTCNYGQWWHEQASSGADDEYHRTYYCSPANQWLPYRMNPNFGATPAPVIDLVTNQAHNLMFQGLSFEPLPLKADPQRLEYTYQPANQPTGTLFWNFVGQSRYNHHIYWDQVLAQCPDPDPNGAMVRCHGFASPFDGSHITVRRSYFSGWQIFHSLPDLDDGSAVVFVVEHGPGPHEFVDNHIECAGICVYYTDDVASTSVATDLTFKRNYVITPDQYWNVSPAWLGNAPFPGNIYWSQRHRFELKRLQRGILDGNIFVGGWVWNNNAAAICLCTRGGAIGAQISALNNATIVTYDASVQYDWGVENLQVGDLVVFQNLAGGTCPTTPAAVYTVATVVNTYTFTVSPSPGCTATRGNVARLANQTANISDVLISNNTLRDSPTGIYMLGHDSYAGPPNGLVSNAMQRIQITNNIATNLDGTRVGTGSYSSAPQVAPSGTFVVPIYGMEDLQVTHNTVYKRAISAFMNSDSGVGGPSSGLAVKANIFEYISGSGIVNDGGFFGAAALNTAWISGTSTQFTGSYNVILRSGGSSGSPYDPTQPPFGPYPALTRWFDTNGGSFPFKDAAAGDFSLTALYRHVDSCYGTPGDCTDDGLDVGVNMPVLSVAQGQARNPRPR